MTPFADDEAGPPSPLDRVRFPAAPWRLVETSFATHDLGTTETLFAVGNGYLGIRGSTTEGRPSHAHGAYVNGFHETWPIRHPEEAFGFAEVGQTIVNVPDATVMRLYVDDEPLVLGVADLVEYERALDLAAGLLTTELVWRTPSGNRVQVRSRRMVSMASRHLAVMTLEVTLLDCPAPVVVSSHVVNRQDGADEYADQPGDEGPARDDPRRAPTLGDRVLEPQLASDEAGRIVLGYRCARSRMTLAVAADHDVRTPDDHDAGTEVGPDDAKHVVRVRAQPHRTLTITKTVSYHTARTVPARELADRCRRTLDRVRGEGVEAQLAQQRAWFDAYWHRSDVQVEGDPEAQQAVRWNLFQLAQAAARADGDGIPAKGVTGSGYEGHYFWDTEIYVLPFFAYTTPQVARNALRFRYTMLPAARRRARELTQDGALFPWRTINGEEASAYYAAGTAQYHIDADVAHAVGTYVEVTGDEEFMDREGLEILVETARMWTDLGFWRGNGGGDSFHIHGVTGPDEYTTVVNDNLFTNVMARSNLRRAARAVRDVAARRPEWFAQLCARLDLDLQEAAEWTRVADALAVPYDPHLGIHPQDSQFHEREVWDLAGTPPDKRPLFLHYHPLVIYRFQVLKQADVVLALFLQGADFTPEQKRADFEYYDTITTGDSTLSAVVQSIVAAEVGYQDLALHYFHRSLYVDLADLHGNASDGVHVASAGGVWSALVCGFGGMRHHDGVLTFDPRLPASWDALGFRLAVRGSRLRVRLRRDALELALEDGPPLTVQVRGAPVEVGDEPVVVPLTDQGPRIEGVPDPKARLGTRRPDGTVVTASVPHETGRNA
ncbi:glycoside hydrolase family 65 protein [Cellulomonas telluris]|uniref:glycoside hydrolase family 65 protein n=1 Tax=Cellulomonas telluris TaxID=2306636 RepID=UPI0010A913AC|nr:glycosyl hydrolase family 65 protein [Cellulomonas telluris]